MGQIGGAYYIGGYAIELALKAIACKKLDVEIFDKEAVSRQVSKSFMIHDIDDLVTLSGITRTLKNASMSDEILQLSWSRVSAWSEQRRYDLACSVVSAEVFVLSLKIVIKWLQQHW